MTSQLISFSSFFKGMNDPCLRYTLVQLRDMARGKIPGFSTMRKKELCRVLERSRLLPATLPAKNLLFQGIQPPIWDFDKRNPIPNFLLPYDYIYGAGSSTNEVVRYFILPENYHLTGVQLPGKGKLHQEFEIIVADYLDKLDLEEKTNKPEYTYYIKGQPVDLHLVYIKGLARGNIRYSNQIAPRLGSMAWNDLLASLQVVGMEGARNSGAQLRREYQISGTLV